LFNKGFFVRDIIVIYIQMYVIHYVNYGFFSF